MSNSLFTTLLHKLGPVIDSGNWEAFATGLPDDFVAEFIVFDGPNVSLDKETFKKHFSSIPGFKLSGKQYKILQMIEGGDKIFLHISTTMRFVRTAVPSDQPYELFIVVHAPEGRFTRLQICTDSKHIAQMQSANASSRS